MAPAVTAKQRYEASAKGQRTRAAYNAAKRAEGNARNNARRVRVGQYYVGMSPTHQVAETINHETRNHFAQKETK